MRIGDPCQGRSGTLSRVCPYGSYCDPISQRCACEPRFKAEYDKSLCRLNKHNMTLTPEVFEVLKCGRFFFVIRAASFGEQCRHVTCEEGLECRGHPKICECARSHKPVDDWSKFVDGHRWNLTSFGIFPPVCVARKSKYIYFSFLSHYLLVVYVFML